MQTQAYAFLIFVLNGILIGILFDIFRIFRKSFKTFDIVTYIEDCMFWIISGLLLLYSIFKFNNGEIRLYILIGVILGVSLYMLIFSKMFINTSVCIIKIIKRIFNIIIIIPIKFLIRIINKIFLKPLKKIFVFLRKRMSIINEKIKKLYFKNRKYKNKKDFA